MQFIGDNTLAAFMKSASFLADKVSEVNEKKDKVSKVASEESDLDKYFKDSVISFSSKFPLTGMNKKSDGNSRLNIASTSKSPTAESDKENSIHENFFNDSPILTKSRYTLRSQSRTPSVPSQSKKPKTLECPEENEGTNNSSNMSGRKSLRVPKKIQKRPEEENETQNSSQGGKSLNLTSECDIPSIITTQDREKLAHWGLPHTILRKYESRGVKSMFPWQVECLSNPQIISQCHNLVYSAPTSAGKTLVSEILIIKTVLERRKKAIFILPFVSVVREKMYYFQDLFSDSGVRVEGFMGGVHPPGGFNATDVAIATIEKANSLVNQMMEEGGLENLGAVVIDELHLLGDPFRGYLLELLLTKLKYMTLKEEQINIQLIGMSATLPNLDLLAKWLDAELYKTDFRPVPLKEMCKIGQTVYDDKLNFLREMNSLPELNVPDSENILQLCLETVMDGHSVLIFCPTKNWTESLAQQISASISQLGRQETEIGKSLRSQLNTEAIKETLEQLKRSPVGLDSVLRSTVSFGVAFHHAGLTMDERDIVEGAFRSGSLRVLTATSTLSSGVNLPARRVIIRTIMFHGKPIDTLTYKQMIGRAGRMGKDSAGESILICKSTERTVATNLLNSGLQPIESCLKGPGPLIRALLEAVASEVAYTLKDIDLYMKCTLLSFTNNHQVQESTKEAVNFLVGNELFLLQTSETGLQRWVATQLGKACLAASVPPKDGLFLFEELQKARRCFVLDTELHVIYLVTPFNSASQIGQINWFGFLEIWKSISESERRVGELVGVTESFLASAVRGSTKPGKILDVHKRFYTALALHDLVREIPLSAVCSKYDCCRGVIQSLQQTAATFAGMVTQFCKKLDWNCIELLVAQFQQRLQFGVCRELLDLLRLPMLNGIRARSLFKEGITTVAELAVADEMDVERALYKALPFESEKEFCGEHEADVAKRNKLRTVFVTGRDGLTPREAAIILVNEARELVKNELGLEEVDWRKKDRSEKNDRPRGTVITRIESNLTPEVLKSDSGLSYTSTSTENAQQSFVRGTEVSKSPSLSIIQNNAQTEIPSREPEISKTPILRNDAPKKLDGSKVVLQENGVEGIGKQTSEESIGEKLKTHEVSTTPKTIFLRQSFVTASDSRSPSLFGDSIATDTHEFNILEQNVIELDLSIFNDTNFSGSSEVKHKKADELIEKIDGTKSAESGVKNAEPIEKVTNKEESEKIVDLDMSIFEDTIFSAFNGTKDKTKFKDHENHIGKIVEVLNHQSSIAEGAEGSIQPIEKTESFGSDIQNIQLNKDQPDPEKNENMNNVDLDISVFEDTIFSAFGGTKNNTTRKDNGKQMDKVAEVLNNQPKISEEKKTVDNDINDDLDIPVFEDTIFPESNGTRKKTKSRETEESIRGIEDKKFIKPVCRNPSATEGNSRSKSIDLDGDSWNNTNCVLDVINKKKATPVFKTKLSESPNSANTLPKSKINASKTLESKKSDQRNIERLRRVTKRKLSSPHAEKSPIARVVTYDSARKLSTGSNASEDDVIVTSQKMEIMSSTSKTRTRMKLESLRIRTQKTLTSSSKTQITPTISTGLKSKRPSTLDAKESSTRSVISNSDEDDPPKKLRAVSRARISSKSLERKKKAKKIDFKDLVIVNISKYTKFNEFKEELDGRKEISMALACEAFCNDTVSIGTRIISTVAYREAEKKSRKIENCVYNNKRLCGVAITWGRNVYYMSFENVQEANRVPIKEKICFLTDLLSSTNLTVRCFSSKEIYKTLFKCCNISPSCKFLDPSVADWLLNPDLPDKMFGTLISEYLPEGQILLQHLGPVSGQSGPSFNVKSSIPGITRACTEAALIWCVSRVLLKKLFHRNPVLLDTFRDIEMCTVVLLSRMELTGLGVNFPALQELSEVIQQELKSLEDKAFSLAGKKFNFSSSRSVAQVLGLNQGKKVCTNKAVLENCDHPIARIVTNWRKLNGTFVKMVCPLLSLAEKTSRIHGNCVTNTVTGRVSMHEPNLQNVPRDFNSADDSFVISVRMAFIPALGNVIVSADYCQLELRVLAHLSGEPELCIALRKPGDVFKNIAARWYNTLESKIDDDMRQRTKQLCYGMIYGMGIKSLAESLQVEENEAKEFLETFMGTYPGIRKWLNEVLEMARKKGFVSTLMERRRFLPGINSEGHGEKGQAERQAINTTVQGSAADIAKKAMVSIDERMREEFPNMPMVLPDLPVKRKLRRSKESLPRGGYLVLQLHDELIYEVNSYDLERVTRIIRECMENCCKLSVPLPVKVKVGPAWGDLEEYKFE